MKVIAWAWLLLSMFLIIVTPFMVGRNIGGVFKTRSCVFIMIESVTIILLAGRVLGWW